MSRSVLLRFQPLSPPCGALATCKRVQPRCSSMALRRGAGLGPQVIGRAIDGSSSSCALALSAGSSHVSRGHGGSSAAACLWQVPSSQTERDLSHHSLRILFPPKRRRRDTVRRLGMRTRGSQSGAFLRSVMERRRRGKGEAVLFVMFFSLFFLSVFKRNTLG